MNTRENPALRRSRQAVLVGAALFLLALLPACSSGPPPHLMLLANDIAVPPAPAGRQRPLLVVRSVVLPEYLDRRPMVYRSADAELKRFPDTVWAERPAESVTRWIAQQLAADLPGREVQAFTADGEGRPRLVLTIQLQSFEAEALPGAAVALHLRGGWQTSGDAVLEGRLDVDVPMAALDAASTVAAMRTALARAGDGIAEQVRGVPVK
jgi:uncharacterized lipoprotein YmbA